MLQVRKFRTKTIRGADDVVMLMFHYFPGATKGDFRDCAVVSLGLTLVNILMIWISSMLMFRMKEVLPIKKKVFWSDLGIARKIYRGKAVLAHKAFDPTASSLVPPAPVDEEALPHED